MEALELLCKRVIALDINHLVNIVLSDKKVQEYIINLNRIDQLYELGIDSDGKSLGIYAKSTISIKKEKGQPTDRVTLKDEGDFYKTFKIRIGKKEFEIDANTEKENVALDEVYGVDILGLTDENLDKVIDLLKVKLVPVIIKYILG